jgi:branched-chain amino acid transport system substrate-binding protein
MGLSIERRGVLGAAFAVAAAAAGWPARAAPPVRIGLLLEMTGPLASTSEDIAYGFALALDEADRRAGGRAIHVVVEDTQGKPARAVERFNKLVQVESVDLVVGPTGSAEAWRCAMSRMGWGCRSSCRMPAPPS